ncbi:MAG: hypothetical protein U0892_02250 [Pirellulales bacterium]
MTGWRSADDTDAAATNSNIQCLFFDTVEVTGSRVRSQRPDRLVATAWLAVATAKSEVTAILPAWIGISAIAVSDNASGSKGR